MKSSVIVTTYNGEKYILEQLLSLKKQSRNIDEVIISDDSSSDSTLDLINKFIYENKLLSNWKVFQNKKNMGFAKNYFRALNYSTGDVIFFCDQDDVWIENKIEIMMSIFENQENVDALFCKENRIDSKGDYIVFNKDDENIILDRINLDVQMRECYGAGHLLAIRRKLYNSFGTNIQERDLTFDIPFCIAASSTNNLYRINKHLVKRRIHGANTSGISVNKFTSIESKERVIKGRKTRLGYYRFALSILPETSDAKKYIEEAINILEKSLVAINSNRVLPIVQELMSKNRFINKKISLGGAYCVLFGK